MNRIGNDDFPYIFDEQEALKFMLWMTLFKHKKGRLSGTYIDPHPIQRFVYGNIYGWRHKDTGHRRFNYLYWQKGRKNAKSQGLAMVGSYDLMALGEQGAEVYCAATKTKQSKLVWDEAKWMLQNSSDLQGKFRVANGEIQHPKSDSKMAYLSKEDGKTGDGTHPLTGIVDEFHLMPTTEIKDVLETGMIGRDNALLAIITTAGFNLTHPAYTIEYDYVTQLLDPNNPIENDNYFAMVNELDEGDDIHDKTNWIKANPIVCSTKEGFEDLEKIYNKALGNSESMVKFIVKNMNVWYHAKIGGYMNLDKWAACGVKKRKIDIPDVHGKDVIIGIDLSSTVDLTSVSFSISLENNEYAVFSHSFIPSETLQKKIQTDKVPYKLWVNQGWMTETEGATVDYRFMTKYIEEQVEKYNWNVEEIAYDPHQGHYYAQEMTANGYTMVEIRQNIMSLSEPTKNFRESVLQNKIYHNDNPVLTWAIANSVVTKNVNEDIRLDKSKSTERIDPIASLINAHKRAMHLNNNNDYDPNTAIDDWLDM
ncbi:phage terminase large subunit-like protein [Virgibacillus halotolerans]|nr:phage terminase large subunit-like protein [Virgibacillus halotolerans]